jgi:L-cysteine:1D-myo-inositol 2-amino-2-deoxy-alpha-D-glucopyranoside ligase
VAKLYVCGITPYDATHLGHAATYVAFDVLQRVWRDAGHQVHYVQNVTDVDDPLLARAVDTGQDWMELAERETQVFREDMTALRVLPPDDYIGVVEAIPQVVDAVTRLRARGAAYDVAGDVYFSVAADPSFGSVSHLPVGQMLDLSAERGGDPERPGKKDPLDPLLWQAERPDDPAWDTDLGRGRPGWHIECAAIAVHYLDAGIDVQGGGADLVFPHHEMTAALAQVLTGHRPFAGHYVHAGMVGLDGQKMSKSLGNLVFVSALRREGRDPAALRLALLDRHYRADMEWTDARLDQAEERLARWREAVDRTSGPDARPLLSSVRERLADDLDTPGALGAVDRWVEEARAADDADPLDEQSPLLVRDLVDALLGVSL